ncbi:unnamed protein product [Ceutorhynchus assimilis]|uniref:Uncharacterized protein n=1 Tax=Ceutorhynchus assimilis TaxID=467358 RepID=A0A9N9MGJ1_9CUCU|nr:unnamed protein product [Ceutorhynchus assimilis]
MFTLPPYPPKDYVLKEVPKLQRSSPQFTPDSQPRVTQTTLGIFCSPVEYAEGERPENVETKGLSPFILEKMAQEARADWIDKPGKDDFFIHDMYKKYTVKFDEFNKHKEKVFNRSYQYELVCIEARRLEKVREKCEREQALSDVAEQKEYEESHRPMKMLPCKAQPPFWWKQVVKEPQPTTTTIEPESRKPTASKRWAKQPCLTHTVVDDPCRRRWDMQLVGQPFKSEACNFYYENYPPPDIEFRPKRFM